MKPLHKGLLLAALHVALVCTLGAKFVYERAHRPRMWIKVVRYDPDLPIRGRYLSLNLEVPAEGFTVRRQPSPYRKDKDGKPLMDEFNVPSRCSLVLRGSELLAIADQNGEYGVNRVQESGNGQTATVFAETAYFLPEHAADPSRIARDEELWMEATIPRKGPPRPIRLGRKKGGVLTPIAD